MISFIENKDIDRKRWDETISSSTNGLIFSFSWFLDLTSPHWDALIEDDYKSVFPIPWNKKYSYAYIHQPLFSNQLGVFSKYDISEEQVSLFLKSIPPNFRYIELGFNQKNKVSAEGFRISEKVIQFIDLNKAYEELKINYDENLKRNLRKAEKAGITIREDVMPEQVTNFFRRGRGSKLGHFTERDYDTLNRLQHEMLKRNCGSATGAYKNDELIGAASFMMSHNRIIFLKGGTNAEGRNEGAMHAIMDAVIKKYSGQNMIFDFGGSVIPSLARFYKSFGAKDYFYQHVKRNTLPFYLRWLKK